MICYPETLALLLACAVLIIGVPLVAMCASVTRWRPLAKKLAITIGAFFAVLTIVLFSAEPIRLSIAREIIRKAEPIIASIEKFKTKRGIYPSTLAEAGTGNADTFWYRPWRKIYFLQFRIDGPPFGWFFVYRPDHNYTDEDDYVSAIQPWVAHETGHEINGWYWFHKM
jgi:hypothetical protein